MTGRVPLITVDAFTDRMFSGNPAGVCLLEKPAKADWMQAVAAEINLAETAFVVPDTSGWEIRWFSPEVEVPLCGHATLASAHVLWETGRAKPEDRIEFDSMSGPLHAWKEGDRIGLDFPAVPDAKPVAVNGLAEALGANLIGTYAAGGWRLAEVATEAELAALTPDFAALRRIDHPVFGVTAKADAGADYACRLFGPSVGVDEDPVTGSVQCALGPLWAERLHKNDLEVRQRSKRGGSMSVRVRGTRVHLLGRAITVLRGDLSAPPG